MELEELRIRYALHERRDRQSRYSASEGSLYMHNIEHRKGHSQLQAIQYMCTNLPHVLQVDLTPSMIYAFELEELN